MYDGLSAADIMAMTRDDGQNNWINNPFIYLVWLALLGGNGGLFGRNNQGDCAMQGALTRSDMFEGFNNQDVNNQLRGITYGLSDGFYAVNTGMLNGFNGVQRDLCQGFNAVNSGINNLGYQMNSYCCSIERNIDAARYEAAQNTCQITNAIHSEGEATRALINANMVQDLRDRLEARDRDILSRDFQLSQLNQNATLINAIKPCPIPAYITCSPYATNNCGTCCCG